MLTLSSRETSNWQNPKGKNVGLKLNIKRDIKIGGRRKCHLQRSFSWIHEDRRGSWNLKLRSQTQRKHHVVKYTGVVLTLWKSENIFFLQNMQSRERKYRHASFYCTSLYCVLQTLFFFYKLKVCGNHALSKSIGAVSLTAFACCLCVAFW